MNKIALLLLFILWLPAVSTAQKNDFIWLPGSGMINEYPFGPNNVYYPWGGVTMDFSVFPPTTTRRNLALDMNVQSMISDNDGNLVAYTNGCHIVNKNDDIMDNGSTINPGPFHSGVTCYISYPAYQGTIFLTDPGSDSLYYLFHMGMEFSDTFPYFAGQKFYYSKINAAANAGLGEVTDKNHLLYPNGGMAPYVSAVKHANGRDWWVVTTKKFTDRYYTFLLDPSGPKYMHQQVIGDSLSRGSQCCGQTGFSPNGAKHFNASNNTGIQLLDFDRCTGLFSNPVFIDSSAVGKFGPLGVSISQNSQFMYVSTSKFVYQFDLTAPDIESSKVLLDSIDYVAAPDIGSFLDAMLAPDGKIYMVSLNYIQDMPIVQFPERKGKACKLEQHGFKLPALYGNDFIFNFPRFRMGPVDGSACDTLGLDNMPLAKFRWDFEDTLSPLQVTFTEVCDYEPTNWVWDFGDGSGSTERYPIHTYSLPGIYEICLITSNVNGSDTLCRTLYLGVSSTQNPTLQAGIQVMPNPFQTNLGVAVSIQLMHPRLSLYNIWGQMVLNVPLDLGFNDVNTADLIQGMYLWRIDATVPGGVQEEYISSGKLIKM